MSLFAELKRRNVFRAAAAYVAVAWLLIQVAEATFPAFGLSEAALRTLIVVLAVGMVPAVALSWAFEITPEGLKRDEQLEPGGELARRTNRLLDRGIVALLALGFAYFAFDKFILDPARDAVSIEQAQQRGRTEALIESYGDNSIAVLPFTNMSADPEQEYFGDGMAEEVLNLLARIPELRVISRSSAFTFKGKDLKLNEIAAELNVAHILEGSVRRAGSRIRVTAQLIEARSDTHLWSQTWDRELEDIFAIQDEIAAEVVANLEITLLGGAPTASRVNPEAKLLFMQARQILDSMRDGAYAQVYDLLMGAIRLDPDYAEPWTGLSWLNYRCFSLRSNRNAPADPFCATRSAEEWLALSNEAGNRALAIDPGNPTANAYQAWNKAFHLKDFQAAADQFRRAAAAAPPPSDVVRPMSLFARQIGRPDLAIRLGEYGIARDPLCTLCLYQLGVAYRDARQYAEAQRVLGKFILLGRGGGFSMGESRLLGGDPAAALEAFDKQQSPDSPEYLARRSIALYSLGQADDFSASLATLESRFGAEAPERMAEVYAWTGDLETASAWLERAIQQRPERAGLLFPFDHLSPFLAPLLALPQWQEILRQYGLADDQLAQIDFEFTLPGE